MFDFRHKKFTVEQLTITILLGLGILFPFLQFLYNRSLWTDEAMLALNIIHKGYFELFKPLDYYHQVAPILFLLIEKLFSTLIPNSEYGLRLLPLMSYWATLFFFFKIVKILFNNKYALIFGLSIFILNVSLIYYSSEVKQYMCDVMTYTAILYLILKDYRNEQTKLYILGIAGIIAIFLSNVAPIILSTAGLYLLYEQFFIKKQKNVIAGLMAVFIIWLIGFSVYYYFFIFDHPSRDFMVKWWSEQKVFLPLDSLTEFVWFLNYKFRSILKMFTILAPLKTIILILLIAGAFSMIRKKKIGLIILTCAPVTIHLILSAFQFYPFAPRLTLYILPGLMLICTAGSKFLITWLSTRFKSLNLKLFCLTPVIFIFSFPAFPIKQVLEFIANTEPMETKETIKYLKKNAVGDETIYVYWLAGASFRYYQDIGLADFKIPVVISKVDRIFTKVNQPDFLEELKQMHGKIWLYFHQDYWGDKEYIINYLDSMGYKRIKEYKTSYSSIYLYDFR